MSPSTWRSPPNWPAPPPGWSPPPGWRPDPAWGPAPDGWSFWSRSDPEPDGPPADDEPVLGHRAARTWRRSETVLSGCLEPDEVVRGFFVANSLRPLTD